MKLFLDEHRQPDVDWVWSRTSGGALTLLSGGCVEVISLAPDQPDLVDPVMDWVLANKSAIPWEMHSETFRAKNRRPLMGSRRVPSPPAYVLQPDPLANL